MASYYLKATIRKDVFCELQTMYAGDAEK